MYVYISSSALTFYCILYLLYLASFLTISLQPNGFSQNIVGQLQDVICSIVIPSDVDPDDIEFGWINEEDIITDDSRVTIDTSPTNASSDYISSTLFINIQFDPLTEEDEGQYICYAIINGSFIFELISLQNFTCK